jgi:hypothetical protein
MSKAPTSSVAPHYALITRGLLLVFACLALWWGITVLPKVWQQSSAERVAKRIIAGDPFKPEALSSPLLAVTAAENHAFCRPLAFESAAIIQLRITETAPGGLVRSNKQLDPLGTAIRNSLSCAPANPFLWLVLYAVQNAKYGFRPEDLNYLRMSYNLGPNEGWILEKRNPVAISQLELLPSDLSAKAIDEFMRLLMDRFYGRAVETFCSTTASRRDVILAEMTMVPLALRRAFARSVYDCGLDVEVPGVKTTAPKRPW